MNPETLRISLDTKAKVTKLPRSHEAEWPVGIAGDPALCAADHDMHPDAVLAAGRYSGSRQRSTEHRLWQLARDTSDFVADCLELWWMNRRSAYPGVRRFLIDLDNGPEIGSSRTQFMKRLVEFSDRLQLSVGTGVLPASICSKYNLIEQCWGILENH